MGEGEGGNQTTRHNGELEAGRRKERVKGGIGRTWRGGGGNQPQQPSHSLPLSVSPRVGNMGL